MHPVSSVALYESYLVAKLLGQLTVVLPWPSCHKVPIAGRLMFLVSSEPVCTYLAF